MSYGVLHECLSNQTTTNGSSGVWALMSVRNDRTEVRTEKQKCYFNVMRSINLRFTYLLTNWTELNWTELVSSFLFR